MSCGSPIADQTCVSTSSSEILRLLSLATRGSNLLTAMRWRLHPRIQLRTDAHHPLGGSVHHKLVVIDDRIAFCGGIDITTGRWDSSQHNSNDPRRINPNGRVYPPWHDIALGVEGPVAAALGDLARDRWQLVTGVSLAKPGNIRGLTPWPNCVEADFERH